MNNKFFDRILMNSLPRQPGLARRLAYGELIRQNRNNLVVVGTNVPIQPRIRTHRLEVNNRNNLSYNYNYSYEELIELEDVKKGLKISEMNKNSFIYAKGSKLVLSVNLCIICQEYFHSNYEIIRELNCGHNYHINCIDKWFEDHVFCPICKHTFD